MQEITELEIQIYKLMKKYKQKKVKNKTKQEV